MGNGIDITLPLGMSASDIDVGTATLDSDRTYNIKDVDASDVQDVIGGTIPEVVHLCKHANVNEWAAFKPHLVTMSNRSGMYASGGEMVWNNPTGEAWRDLGHFAGYNHQAPTPYINVAETYYYTYDGEETEKQTEETMIVTLPEFDVRTDVANGQTTHWTTKVTCELASGDKVTETHGEIIDDEAEVRSLSASFKIYRTNDNSYDIEIEVWFGTTNDYYIFKHPDSPKTATASKQTDYQLSVISEDFDYQVDYSNATVNNTTGAYAYDLIITDQDTAQRGGTARENVYIDGELTDIGEANFSASDTITNSDTLPTEMTPLTNDVVIILTDFDIDPL